MRLQVPDRLATFSRELENTSPAEQSQELGVEVAAALDVRDDEIEMVDSA